MDMGRKLQKACKTEFCFTIGQPRRGTPANNQRNKKFSCLALPCVDIVRAVFGTIVVLNGDVVVVLFVVNGDVVVVFVVVNSDIVVVFVVVNGAVVVVFGHEAPASYGGRSEK